MNHARANTVPLRLIEGGLVNVAREETIKRMAADLVTYDAFRNKQDAVRCLMSRGYRNIEVAMWMPDARALAFQDVVAREMVEP